MELEPRSLHAERVCRTALSEDDKLEFEACQVSFSARVALAAGYTHLVFCIRLTSSGVWQRRWNLCSRGVTKKAPVRGDAVAMSAGDRRHRVTQRASGCTMTGSVQKVGYKRPPAHTRFRPGQSGNPSGRPRRRPDFQAALLAELAETMPDADRARGSTKLEALVKTLVDSAIAGNARAQSILCSVLTRLGDPDEAESKPLTPDDQALLDEYVGDELKRRAAEAKPMPAGDHSKPGDGHDR